MGEGQEKVKREVDGGLKKIDVKIKEIVKVDMRIKKKRYDQMKKIMKEKKKKIEEKQKEDLGEDIEKSIKVMKKEEKGGRKDGVKVGQV